MGFLKELTKHKEIYIQCHNNPDADSLASAYAVERYLKDNGVITHIIYGGNMSIKKSALKMMMRECKIDVVKADEIDTSKFLLLVDCQKGNGNVFDYGYENVAIIDHHLRTVEENDMYLIKNYQSCSTLIWELLNEENYKTDYSLEVALLYGLYTDTSSFADLYSSEDTKMKMALYDNQPLFDRLAKSNMSLAELLIAGDALLHHYLDFERGFAIIEAVKCDQSVLGAIGDIVICVDVISLSFVCTETPDGYQISLRSSHDVINARDAAVYICKDIGSGGGHANKAGGYISKNKMKQKYKDEKFFDIINRLLSEYTDSCLKGENK